MLFAALGLGASLVSSYVHYSVLENPAFSSFCDVSATVSCTQAYLSGYGSVFGVPVALTGVLFFGFILLLASLSGRRTSHASQSAPAYIFALSTAGLAFVAYLAYASFFVLRSVCLLCAITYVATIALLVVSRRATTVPMKSLPGRVARDLRALASNPVALTLCALFVIGAASVVGAFPKQHTAEPTAEASSAPPLTADQRAEIARWWDMQPKVDVPVAANGARVLMVKFSDYQCPGCGATYMAYAPLIEKWTRTGRFQFALEDFPLEPECNAAVHSIVHGASCEAAAAVEMARQRHDGSDARLESWLFTHQEPMLSPDDVLKAAREIAGIEDFAAEYQQALAHVRRAADMGAALAITRTPTFFINGRKLEGGQDPRVIDAVIELEMARGE
jgi:uncharacterized membrane protein/protein-disulfide isomerase